MKYPIQIEVTVIETRVVEIEGESYFDACDQLRERDLDWALSHENRLLWVDNESFSIYDIIYPPGERVKSKVRMRLLNHDNEWETILPGDEGIISSIWPGDNLPYSVIWDKKVSNSVSAGEIESA